MTVQVVYKNKLKTAKSGAIILFVDEKLKFDSKNNLLNKSENQYVKKILFNKRKKTDNTLFSIDIDENKIAIIIIVKQNSNTNTYENLGAKLFDFIKKKSYYRNIFK